MLRVREVQARLAEADAARARDKAAGERRLVERVSLLAAEIAPTVGGNTAAVLGATALYRDRLHQSAAAAATRLHATVALADRAVERVTDARRDRTAAEKLLARAQASEAERERRREPDPPSARRDRHEPC